MPSDHLSCIFLMHFVIVTILSVMLLLLRHKVYIGDYDSPEIVAL